MKASIRFKLLAIILLSCALPLALGVASLGYFGYRYYSRNKGQMYQGAAVQLAQNIGATTNAQIKKLSDWIALSNLEAELGNRKVPAGIAGASPEFIERQWKRLEPDQFPIQPILENDIARRLRAFQSLNPLFKEIFITDERGLVIAATNKTSDYIQSDESWWKKTKNSPPRVAWLEGISFDESAKVYSLDIAFALRNPQSNAFQGVVKAVLNVSLLFAALPHEPHDANVFCEVVLDDGRILTQLFYDSYQPLSNRYKNFREISQTGRGWLLATLKPLRPREGEKYKSFAPELIGTAALRLEGDGLDHMAVDGLTSMTVIVREDAGQVLAPIRNQLWMMGLVGGALLMGLSLAALMIADRKIISPLRLLRDAARGVAQTARLEESYVPDAATQNAARAAVQQCRDINTGDEIENLADDFALMAERVLRYHQQLESEIASKTQSMQRDLQIARDFQESLLPTEYPHSSDDAGSQSGVRDLHLDFHHVYQPAQTMGGDFYDVFKLPDQCVGIFIADVMGHGARSALVSSILRTLLRDLSSKTNDPSALMALVNRHFFEILQGSSQFVFVSAFCLVIDARARHATYANAGHPSPLVAQAASGQVLPLLGHASRPHQEDHTNAALGVARDTTYFCHSRPVASGESFFLYTDGVVEAPSPEGEEFGVVRLQEAISLALSPGAELSEKNKKMDVASLSAAAMSALEEWTQNAPSPDDICLVVVSADEAPAPASQTN